MTNCWFVGTNIYIIISNPKRHWFWVSYSRVSRGIWGNTCPSCVTCRISAILLCYVIWRSLSPCTVSSVHFCPHTELTQCLSELSIQSRKFNYRSEVSLWIGQNELSICKNKIGCCKNKILIHENALCLSICKNELWMPIIIFVFVWP